MRVILVVPCFYPESRGGAERQALILAEAMGRMGADVTLVAPTKWAEAPQVEQTSFGRIERHRVRAYPNQGGRYLASFLNWTTWFRRRYTGDHYAAVPIYVFHARLHALGPALAARANGVPLVVKLGGGGESSDFVALRAKKFFYGKWVQDFLLRGTDCFVANGKEIVDDLEALGVPDDRIEAFPNGVVLPDRSRLIKSIESRSGNRFVFAGRMVPDKNVQTLFDAGQAVSLEGRRAHLTFLGEGPERERLMTLSGSSKGSLWAEFPGFVADIYPELFKADFFVSASRREGQSNALLEAMAAGLIPIVYEASGVREVVDHGRTGFVVTQSDAEAFAHTMRSALTLSPEKRRQMSLDARDFAEENIGIDAIAKRTLRTLTRVCEARRLVT